MRRYTQRELKPGNCWQTAIACVIEVEPAELPPQTEIAGWPSEALDGWGSYRNVLVGYLRKHFGCTYAEVPAVAFGALRIAGPFAPYHCCYGPSPRTVTAGDEQRINHAIVGCDGVPLWDPHPSRDGLVKIEQWGVIGTEVEKPAGDFHERWRDAPSYKLIFGCLCPSCNLDAARELVAQWKPPPEDDDGR